MSETTTVQVPPALTKFRQARAGSAFPFTSIRSRPSAGRRRDQNGAGPEGGAVLSVGAWLSHPFTRQQAENLVSSSPTALYQCGSSASGSQQLRQDRAFPIIRTQSSAAVVLHFCYMSLSSVSARPSATRARSYTPKSRSRAVQGRSSVCQYWP